MVKTLLGLAAVVVIAVGGFFGFEFYTQHRIAGDVEAAFEQIRAGGGKASHGKVSFDLRSRTVRIADIATESATQPPVSVTIAAVTAAGVSQPDAEQLQRRQHGTRCYDDRRRCLYRRRIHQWQQRRQHGREHCDR